MSLSILIPNSQYKEGARDVSNIRVPIVRCLMETCETFRLSTSSVPQQRGLRLNICFNLHELSNFSIFFEVVMVKFGMNLIFIFSSICNLRVIIVSLVFDAQSVTVPLRITRVVLFDIIVFY